jgi:hypothetical protein
MADDIVQTIKIEVDGADQAANEIKKVGQATEEVQQTAEKSAGGTQELGKGLDQVSQKSGVSSRELRALSKVAKEAGADAVVTGLSFVRMATILGPIGAALFAVAEAFGSLSKAMKQAEEQTKAVANTFANLAEKSAQMKLKDQAAFWGMSEAAMKEWNNEAERVVDQYKNIEAGRQKAISADVSSDARQKGLIELLQQAGVQIGDLDADTDKLGESANKALMVFAKLGEKMSPIGKAELAKDIKALGFTDQQIKNIEKGSEALKKIQAAGPIISEQDLAALKQSSELFDDWGQRLQVKFAKAVVGWKKMIDGMKAGDFRLITASIGELFSQLGGVILSALAPIGSAIAELFRQWVTTLTTPIGGAWQWIVDTASSVWEQVKALAGEAWNAVVSFVTTAPGNAWQWIVDTAASVWEQTKALALQAYDAVVSFVTTAPGSAWQWIADTATSVWEQVKALASGAYQSIVSFVTTPVGDAWQWIVDTWNAMLAKLGFGGGAAAAPAGGGIPGQAGGGLLGGRGSGTSDSNLAWVSRGEYIVPARIVQQPGMLPLLEALRLGRFAGGGSVGPGGIPAYAGGGPVQQLLVGIADTLVDLLQPFIDGMREVTGLVVKTVSEVTWRLKDAHDKLEGWAGGGLLGGRGTGTSDSNLAWVSRGEFITPARAVRQPGVLAFLEALRHSGGNLRDILDGMGRFALGGLTPHALSLPALAGGGAMNNVTIQFPGLPEITGLRASSAVVDELRKAAAMAQVRSGGRKPSRYS